MKKNKIIEYLREGSQAGMDPFKKGVKEAIRFSEEVKKNRRGLITKLLTEASFGALNRNDWVYNENKKIKEESPRLARAAELAGLGSTMFIPAAAAGKGIAAAAKVLKIRKLGKLIAKMKKASEFKKGALSGGLYGGARGAGEYTGDPDNRIIDKRMIKAAARDAVKGSLAGGVVGKLMQQGVHLKSLASPRTRTADTLKRLTNVEKLEKILKTRKEAGKTSRDMYNALTQGDEKTKAYVDAAYLNNARVREIVNKLKDKFKHNRMTEFNRVMESSLGRMPDKDKLVNKIKKAGQKKAEILYNAFRKSGKDVNLSGPIIVEPTFKETAGKVIKKSNPTDPEVQSRGRGLAPKIADKVKKRFDDMISKELKKGGNNEARDILELKNKMVSEIDKQMPIYKKARGEAEKYLKAQEAGKVGEEMFKEAPKKEIAKFLKSKKKLEQATFKEGYLAALKDFSHKKETSGPEFPDVSYMFRNANAREIIKLLEKNKGKKLLENMDKFGKVHRNLSELTTGSKTAEHLSNKEIGETLKRVAVSSKRALVRALGNIGPKAVDKEVVSLLLKPKSALEYIKKAGSKGNLEKVLKAARISLSRGLPSYINPESRGALFNEYQSE